MNAISAASLLVEVSLLTMGQGILEFDIIFGRLAKVKSAFLLCSVAHMRCANWRAMKPMT